MPDLTITVQKAEAVPLAAQPTINFDLRIENANPDEPINTAILRCQFQLEVARRQYNAQDQENLRDLFGTPDRWGQTLRPMLWTHASVVVPAFTGGITLSVPVVCTFDFNIGATKYFAGVSEGDIPLCLMFSGTVFYEDAEGCSRVAPISWDKEARFRLPVSVWKQMMDLYYPNCAWLCLRKDAFEKIHRFKIDRGIPTWEETIDRIFSEVLISK